MPNSRLTSEAKHDTAKTKLTEAVASRKRAESEAEKARHRVFRFCLKAYSAGLTYKEIAAITGLSEIRICQVLQEQRSKNGNS